MKIVAKQIKTLAVFQYDDGTTMPYKFKIKGGGSDPEECSRRLIGGCIFVSSN